MNTYLLLYSLSFFFFFSLFHYFLDLAVQNWNCNLMDFKILLFCNQILALCRSSSISTMDLSSFKLDIDELINGFAEVILMLGRLLITFSFCIVFLTLAETATHRVNQ